MKCYVVFITNYNGYSYDSMLVGVFKTIESAKEYMFKEFEVSQDQWTPSSKKSNSTIIASYDDEIEEESQTYTIEERTLQ